MVTQNDLVENLELSGHLYLSIILLLQAIIVY